MINIKGFKKNYSILTLIGMVVLLGVGCDSSVDATNDIETVTVSGQVSQSEAHNQVDAKSEQASREANTTLEGAVVTAVAVQADGTVSALDGETTTNASGEFTLIVEGEGAADHIRVIINGDNNFETSAIVQVNGQSSVSTRPLTTESHAEAEVYLEAKSNDGSDSHFEGVTKADVSIFIDSDVAAEIHAGAINTAEMGIAIANAMKAQAEYNTKAEADVALSVIAEAKSDIYARLQSDLAAASSIEARAEAYATFQEAYINVFAENGTDIETQSQFHQIASTILIEASGEANGNAELALRKQAELVFTKATALAIEATFQAENASEATLEALADARTEVIAEIKGAASVDAIVDAKEDYKAKIDSLADSGLGVRTEARVEAEAEIASAIKILQSTFMELSLFGSNIVEATAEAFTSYYMDAQIDAKASFEASGMTEAEAETAAKITVMAVLLVNA